MKVEQVYEGIRYTLTNDNIKNGDEVFPIANGRCLDDGGWILHNIDFRDFMSGFPKDPHRIKDINYSDSKPYQVQTNKGYGPIDKYYKIIKMEHQIEERPGHLFPGSKWVEIDVTPKRSSSD